MKYNNQLVLTGDLNDVGASIRTNVPDSYRLGTEINASVQLHDHWFWNANGTWSRNKIQSFTEVLFDYTIGFDVIENKYENTDIAFSPNLIAANAIMYRPTDQLEFELTTKYVGDQFLDNTSNENRKLDAYTFSNLRVGYQWNPSFVRSIEFTGMVYNIFNTQYSSNGYTYSYIFNDLITENYVYPQAGRHFMVSALISL